MSRVYEVTFHKVHFWANNTVAWHVVSVSVLCLILLQHPPEKMVTDFPFVTAA